MERSVRSSNDVRSARISFAIEGSESGSPAVAFRSGRQPNIFARLTTSQRNRVIARGVDHQLSEGETLFAQGERHRAVYLVENGLIRTFYTSPAGCEITLAYWQAGNVVGTPQGLGTSAHMWSGIATVRTKVLAFRSDDIRELMQRIPAPRNLALSPEIIAPRQVREHGILGFGVAFFLVGQLRQGCSEQGGY